MELAFSKAKSGSANYSDIDKPEKFNDDGWMGWHTTDCGHEDYDSNDYLLENGMITNSMCIFYVKRYRYSIHENDWKKLKDLGEYYGVNIQLPDSYPTYKPSTLKDNRTMEEKIEAMLVEELTKAISKEILKNQNLTIDELSKII